VRTRTWQALALAASVLVILVVIFALSSTPRSDVPASPTIAVEPGTQTAVVTSPNASPSGAVAWSRGMYLETIDPQLGLAHSNTRLISITRTLQRSQVHNEIAWTSIGPWSPDGTAVVAAEFGGQVFVIWLDSLTKLPPTSGSSGTFPVWTWLDAATLGAVIPAGPTSDEWTLVRVDAHTGQILKRDAIVAWPFGSTVSPKGDWTSFVTAGADGREYEALTVSTTQRVSSGPLTMSAGWLSDGRFVFVRQSSATPTVEVRDPTGPEATVVGRFDFPIEVLAQPSSSVIVVHDSRIDKNQLWTLRGAAQRAVPLQYSFCGQLRLESLSHDGHSASFSMPEVPGVGLRTGFIDLETGAVTFICDGGCFGLVIN
jgi:hypothetical protein